MLTYLLSCRETGFRNLKSVFELEILHARSNKSLATISNLSPASTILDVKKEYERIKPNLYCTRQSFRLEPRGKLLNDAETLTNLGINKKGSLYFRDLGPQVSWTTVFLVEYAGPLAVYLAFYVRPALIYGTSAASEPRAPVVNVAAACWSVHYAKRLYETIFVHRFSHATMPIRNIFKNCFYYWGFAAFVAYFMNHPFYTSPALGDRQIYAGLAGFILAELGNFSIHVALRNLRPEGTTTRRIPYPTANPFTYLFGAVSCPNYTYETLTWVSFTVMTQCLPVAIFAVAGFAQMLMWALGKHRNYKREFKEYPRDRKAILPFII